MSFRLIFLIQGVALDRDSYIGSLSSGISSGKSNLSTAAGDNRFCVSCQRSEYLSMEIPLIGPKSPFSRSFIKPILIRLR